MTLCPQRDNVCCPSGARQSRPSLCLLSATNRKHLRGRRGPGPRTGAGARLPKQGRAGASANQPQPPGSGPGPLGGTRDTALCHEGPKGRLVKALGGDFFCVSLMRLLPAQEVKDVGEPFIVQGGGAFCRPPGRAGACLLGLAGTSCWGGLQLLQAPERHRPEPLGPRGGPVLQAHTRPVLSSLPFEDEMVPEERHLL